MLSVAISNRTLFELETDAERHILAVWCFIALIINFTCNTIILLAATWYRAINLDRISVVLIQSIAISDILMGLVTIHPTMVSLIANKWLYGDVLCYLNHFLKVPIFISALHLICAMHISKLLSLVYPLRARTWTKKAGFRVVCVVLVLSCVIPVTQLALDRYSVTFDYRLYRCHFVFRGLFWKWLRPFLIGSLMVLPNVVVLCTTVALLVFVKVSTKRMNLQGAFTALYVGLVYILACSPVALNQSLITNFYPAMSKKVFTFFFVHYSRYAFFVTFFNSFSNFFVYLVSVKSFQNFMMNKFKGSFESLSSISQRSAVVTARFASWRRNSLQ